LGSWEVGKLIVKVFRCQVSGVSIKRAAARGQKMRRAERKKLGGGEVGKLKK